MVARYFAYGSNMNPQRVRERGMRFTAATGASLRGFALAFDKTSARHPGVGHANVVFAPESVVEGVLYELHDATEIAKMDPFERTPINYSREIVTVHSAAGDMLTWTYFANPAVRRDGLQPPRSYLNHLLEGRPFLSEAYFLQLAAWQCDESR